jgi:hypothetical protein
MKLNRIGALCALIVPTVFASAARADYVTETAASAAARAAHDVCATAKRDGKDIADAARNARLRLADPQMAMPNYTPGSLAWRVPSSEGEVFLYESAKGDCLVAIAYSPAEGADLAADALEKTGMHKGQSGKVGLGGRYQQLTTEDGRVYVNAVAYERVAGKPAPAITAVLQVGAN